MQSQLSNTEEKYTSFAQLLAHVPAAEKLHFLVSAEAVNYINQLGDVVPDMPNALGKHFLPFSNFRFEIITPISMIKAAIALRSILFCPLTWHDTIGPQLLVSLPDKRSREEILTELASLQPFLSIYSTN